MAENICLMYLEYTEKKKNQFASYDFHTRKFRWLTEKDREWWLPYYDQGGGLSFYALSEYMPNNYDL